jgi:TonB-dependent Receptor Plug Domain/Carboxypeptidase regulatory-like domain
VSLFTGVGRDSTDRLVMQLSANGFLRKDLYVGQDDPATTGVRRGTGRLVGTVVSADGGRAVPGAFVRVVNGAAIRANDRGEFVLSDVPAGSRMLDVRSVGFSPDRRAVDVVDGAAPVQIVLSTLKAVLDTVRVRAERLAVRHLSGFSERKRAGGMGRFLTADDIARRQLTVMSDLFRTIPGTRVQPGEEGQPLIMIRGTLDEWCQPAWYVDGRNMGELSLEVLDGWVRPQDVAGIEVYPGAATPPQFSLGMAGTGCGSIVIWTR